MVVTLLAYFFYVVTAFTVAMALLVHFFDDSTSAKMLHYPRPITVRMVEEPHPLATPETRERQSAKTVSEKDTEGSRIFDFAKSDLEKNKHKTLDGSKMSPRKHENDDRRRNGIALGYAQASGYRPGLDGQR
jgi:hypothetical protein